MFIEVNDIKKSYGEGGSYVQVLKGVTTGIEKGQICAILGPSGSGKSTLLNTIGGFDTVDSGSIKISNIEITKLNPKELSLYRRNYLGFVFQFYNLVPNLTVRENIQVCEYLTKTPLDINELLEILGLSPSVRKNFHLNYRGGSNSGVLLPEL